MPLEQTTEPTGVTAQADSSAEPRDRERTEIDAPDSLTNDGIEFRDEQQTVEQGARDAAAAPAQTAYRLNRYERQRIADALTSTRMQDAGRLREIRAARESLEDQMDAHLSSARPMLPGSRQREWDERRAAIQAPLDELDQEAAQIKRQHSDLDTAVEQHEQLEAARDDMLDRSVDLLESAVEEKILEQPEWLTAAIGVPPIGAAGAWHAVASSITTYRLVNDIADTADLDLDALMPSLAAQRDHVRAQQGLGNGQAVDKEQAQSLGIGM